MTGTTQHWYQDYSKVLGLLSFIAGIALIVMKNEEIGVPLVAAATGIALGKVGGAKIAPVFLAGVLAFSAFSCAPARHISVDAVEPALIEVLDRHDTYVNADESLPEFIKNLYLRTTELLRKLLEEAKKGS